MTFSVSSDIFVSAETAQKGTRCVSGKQIGQVNESGGRRHFLLTITQIMHENNRHQMSLNLAYYPVNEDWIEIFIVLTKTYVWTVIILCAICVCARLLAIKEYPCFYIPCCRWAVPFCHLHFDFHSRPAVPLSATRMGFSRSPWPICKPFRVLLAARPNAAQWLSRPRPALFQFVSWNSGL